MATISEEMDVSNIPRNDVENVSYSAEKNWLYVRLPGNEYYFVTVNGRRITEGESVDQKALDSSEANDRLDQLISDADDD